MESYLWSIEHSKSVNKTEQEDTGLPLADKDIEDKEKANQQTLSLETQEHNASNRRFILEMFNRWWRKLIKS